jgi:hypothetical protein
MQRRRRPDIARRRAHGLKPAQAAAGAWVVGPPSMRLNFPEIACRCIIARRLFAVPNHESNAIIGETLQWTIWNSSSIHFQATH